MSGVEAVVDLPGVTTVSDRAVRRIVARAAREVDGVLDDVRVTARVTADTAALSVELPIRYPMPIGRVADACRAHLIERARELAGVSVSSLDIAISALNPAAESGRVR
ncbi:Asp23/Gls24 family envelope stress response protein [Nocardia sp. NPDC051570]|uniref:Asp23/Gls24 family envelope stress response protein n=1 Tax=Nocardia sp. NPDC051570 TaxID=3364324 RepID=UPI0037A49FD8